MVKMSRNIVKTRKWTLALEHPKENQSVYEYLFQSLRVILRIEM